MYIKASDQFKTIMNELTKTKYNTINFKYKHIKGLISVIIPVYKDAKGLHDTLTSLQKQTLDKSKYEVIIANDGDDSHVSEVCKEFEVKEISEGILKTFPVPENLSKYYESKDYISHHQNKQTKTTTNKN